jgi:hypothetical protein
VRWQGPQLVIETELPRDRRMTTTWSIVPTTRQLLMMRVALGRGALETAELAEIAEFFGG